jgi:hypothetical protein
MSASALFWVSVSRCWYFKVKPDSNATRSREGCAFKGATSALHRNPQTLRSPKTSLPFLVHVMQILKLMDPAICQSSTKCLITSFGLQ